MRRAAAAGSGPAGERLLGFWGEALAGAPQVLELPTDRPRGRSQTFRGGLVARGLPAPLADRLRALGRAESATLFAVAAAAYAALLGRWSGQDELVFGTPTAGRLDAASAAVVGYFVNPVVVVADLAGDPTAAEVVRRVRCSSLAAFAHQELPFPLVAERLAPERDPARSPVFQALFLLQRGRGPLGRALAAVSIGAGAPGPLALGPLTLEPIALPPRGAQVDLSLAVAEPEGDAGLAASLTYNADLFDAATADRFLGHLAALLDGLDRPEARAWELPILSPAERRAARRLGRERGRAAASAPPPRPLLRPGGADAGGDGGARRRARRLLSRAGGGGGPNRPRPARRGRRPRGAGRGLPRAHAGPRRLAPRRPRAPAAPTCRSTPPTRRSGSPSRSTTAG